METLWIQPLPLLQSLPHSSAIALTGSGPERYAPEFWAIGYRARKLPPDIQAAVLVLSRSNVN
jgi:hypothetical protein